MASFALEALAALHSLTLVQLAWVSVESPMEACRSLLMRFSSQQELTFPILSLMAV
jgi:hypothetical protein